MNLILRQLRALDVQRDQAEALERLMDGASGGLPDASGVAPYGWANRTLHVDANGEVRKHVSYLDGRRN